MRTPYEEREVHISYTPFSDTAEIYTSDYSYIAKLDKYCKDNPEEWKCIREEMCDGDVAGKAYECPKKLILIKRKSPSRAEMTEEQKIENAARLAAARAAKATAKDDVTS